MLGAPSQPSLPQGSSAALHSPASLPAAQPFRRRGEVADSEANAPSGWPRLGNLFWPRRSRRCQGLLRGRDNRRRKGVEAGPPRSPGSCQQWAAQPGQEVTHPPAAPGSAGGARGPGGCGQEPRPCPSLCGRGSTSPPGNWLDSQGRVCPRGPEAPSPPGGQRPPLLYENRPGFGSGTAGSSHTGPHPATASSWATPQHGAIAPTGRRRGHLSSVFACKQTVVTRTQHF